MRPIRLLLDHNVARMLLLALQRHAPAIEVMRVGFPPAPSRETRDPDILLWCEKEQVMLISADRKTMQRHHGEHLVSGHHSWGVLLLRRGAESAPVQSDLCVILGASDAEDWIDTIDFLPFRQPLAPRRSR